jgi:hypothetical protein
MENRDGKESADELTENEKHRFIVQDNIQHGKWDFEESRDNWDVDELGDWDVDIPEITEPDDQQPEPNVFDGFTVVMKIDSETMPKVEQKLNELANEHGFEIDIS